LARQSFPKAKTPRSFDPEHGQDSPAAAKERLTAAVAGFEGECRARAASAKDVTTSTFGTVPLEDYARFQALHIEHHCKQILTTPQ